MFKKLKKLLFISPIIVCSALPMVSMACTPQQQYKQAIKDWNLLLDQYKADYQNGSYQYKYLVTAMENASKYFAYVDNFADEDGGHYSANHYFQLVASLKAKEEIAKKFVEKLNNEPQIYDARKLDIILIYFTININANDSSNETKNINSLVSTLTNTIGDITKKTEQNSVKTNYDRILNIYEESQQWIRGYITIYDYLIKSKLVSNTEDINKTITSLKESWTKFNQTIAIFGSDLDKDSNNCSELYNLLKNGKTSLLNTLQSIENKDQYIWEQIRGLQRIDKTLLALQLSDKLLQASKWVFYDVYAEILFSFYQKLQFASVLTSTQYINLTTSLSKAGRNFRQFIKQLETNPEISPEELKEMQNWDIFERIETEDKTQKVIPGAEFINEINDKIKEYLKQNNNQDNQKKGNN
ncbi:hypothetical protein [Mycoplasma seminis]|uniref:Lipoprotein n=1 Tax=Mycoplasma seminis TaxID=512749 RepID=A0ABY9HBR9_9MOLU|nr:hypothetical protein [Mycoplasma seminis]WLP85649.1 hypothetical protein Q8852_00610 [Mycoplasma seminis]